MPRFDLPPIPPASADIRLRGFGHRRAVAELQAWIDDHVDALGGETVPLAFATGRVLSEPVTAGSDRPPGPLAALDGWAVPSAATIGASPYNPLLLPRNDAAAGQTGAQLLARGTALPPGTDAVLPFWLATPMPLGLEVVEAVAVGGGVIARAQECAAGARVIEAGRRLGPIASAALTALGIETASVVRKPRVTILPVPSERAHGWDGAVSAVGLVTALLARDGAEPVRITLGSGKRHELAVALRAPAVDLALVLGGCGSAADDEAPLALADAGELLAHGLALRPGGTAGLGRVGRCPVALLPPDPLGAFAAYELVAGRIARRLAGLAGPPPYARCRMPLAGKVVSEPGTLDLVLLETVGRAAFPLPPEDAGDWPRLARATGFILVAPEHEGYADGPEIEVRFLGAAPSWVAAGWP